ncbi:MAG: FtsX-like permease family protein, partial [Acidobacteriia bacterium]|nr:FtsX-like permease family protein [Terriglobia bacterium]
MSLPASKYRAPAAQAAFADEVLQRARSIPGVQSAAITNSLPLDPVITMSWTLLIEGRPESEDAQSVYFRAVSPDYFGAMGLRLRRGTLLVDSAGVEPAVVNEAMVRRYWPEARHGSLEPIGRRINVARRWRVIVGVVSDIKYDDPARATAAEVYVPFHSDAGPWMTLLARVNGDPMRFGSAFRNAVWAVDRDEPVYDVQPLDRIVYASVAAPRFRMTLLGIFAALALALAAVGIYGVMAYAVAQRTHEIGIRMALGAARGNVLRMVVREGLALAAAGVALGLAGAFAATRVLNSFLFGVTATDVRTLAAVSILLAAVAAAASYVPARRATRVDPNVALRWE